MDIQPGKFPEQSTFLSGELLAKALASLASEREQTIQEVDLSTSFVNWCGIENQDGLFGKMCRESYRLTEEETLVPSSGRWLNSGIISAGGFLTLNTSDCPIEEKESSLSGIIQTEQVDTKFYLSKLACQGFIRRDSMGKSLPVRLKEAMIAHSANHIQP
jgi:hypothetical protein